MRPGAVAEAAGVNRETLRYYERRGIIPEPARSLGGHRQYPPQTVTVLRIVKAAQRLGFSLAEIEELLAVGTHRHDDAGLHARALAKLAEVEQKIADLTVIAGTLRQAVAAGCDDLVSCAADDRCPIPFADLASGDSGGARG